MICYKNWYQILKCQHYFFLPEGVFKSHTNLEKSAALFRGSVFNIFPFQAGICYGKWRGRQKQGQRPLFYLINCIFMDLCFVILICKYWYSVYMLVFLLHTLKFLFKCVESSYTLYRGPFEISLICWMDIFIRGENKTKVNHI